jgi:hypothetical protein
MASCEQFSGTLPADLKELGSGQLDAVNSSVRVSGTGGQSCYVEIKNNSPHFTPITVRYFIVGEGGVEHDLCATSYQIFPFRTDIFKYSVFGEKISWNTEVSLAVDVDAALLLVRTLAGSN